MKISYDGDTQIAVHFTQIARQEFERLKTRPAERGRFVRTFRTGWGEAMVWFTIGDGMDGIHIVAKSLSSKWPVPLFFSGAVISEGQISSSGLLAYAPTVASREEFGFTGSPLILPALAVPPHASMPIRIEGGAADSQYTAQAPSKYTGKMCRLVQAILGYGKLREDTTFASVIGNLRDSEGKPLTLSKSVLWLNDNDTGGVKNTFGWEWARTTGIFTRTHVVSSVTVKEYWLIEISVSGGVKAMPLQIEPVTALPQFRAIIVAALARPGHRQCLNDILLLLDEFGGFPSAEGFLTTNTAIHDTIVTLLTPEAMPAYVGGLAVSLDHGWAFNEDGTRANTVCLESYASDSWYMAHHCQVSIGFDVGAGRPTAAFDIIESGAAPLSKHALKVGVTALDACISYNLTQQDHGDTSARPRATRTAMFVFWKQDRLEALRWADARIDPSTNQTETSSEIGVYGMEMHYLLEVWFGASGLDGGFFSTLHDGRIPTVESHTRNERTIHVANEKVREIGTDPATDNPVSYSRAFWRWQEVRSESWTGGRTDNSCAFVPLGDRSAFYLVTMTTSPQYHDNLAVYIGTIGDPYSYAMSPTYIWNWDFGNLVGHKFPVTWAGTTDDGIVDVVWDRSGSRGKCQLETYGPGYIWGPSFYKGGYGQYAWDQTQQDWLDKWTALTGLSEWMDIGVQPDNSVVNPFAGAAPAGYFHVSGGITTLSVYLVSMQATKEVFKRTGSYLDIYHDYNYWFDRSPNTDGDYQTMWAFKNCLGGQFYQLYSTDVNDRNLATEGGYPLDPSDFPTFIGVVGEIPA